MTKPEINLIPLREDDRPAFIQGLQAAFKIAVVEEFGENEDEVISASEIEDSLNRDGAEAFNIVCGGERVGGVVVAINTTTCHNALELFYLHAASHNKGIGAAAWQAIEQRYPETKVWETITPYFEKRNIHFYVNKCGFRIVEFFNPHHPSERMSEGDSPDKEYFFRFEKVMQEPKGENS